MNIGPFDETDEADSAHNRLASDRLQRFTKALWDALVPAEGPCASVQGELVRANARLQAEFYRNGMANYFAPPESGKTLADNFYGELVLFLIDTLVANRGQALSEVDVAYFTAVRGELEPQWLRGLRSDELFYKQDEEETGLDEAEKAELAELDALPRGPEWENLFNRAERCIANYCLSNTALTDRHGTPVSERGTHDVMHIFTPPPAPPPCPLCGGKGWIAPNSPSEFPSVCSCKQ